MADSGRAEFLVETTLQSWTYLSRVEVLAPASTSVVVALGNSIADGYQSTPDANARWPDVLASRLVREFSDRAPAVLNVGISGNRVLRSNVGFEPDGGVAASDPLNPNAGFGPNALARFDRDVLLQPAVTHVIVLESITTSASVSRSRPPPTRSSKTRRH